MRFDEAFATEDLPLAYRKASTFIGCSITVIEALATSGLLRVIESDDPGHLTLMLAQRSPALEDEE